MARLRALLAALALAFAPLAGLALVLAPVPAVAQQIVTPAASASTNPNLSYDNVGYAADGSGTTLAAGTGTAYGNWTYLGQTTAALNRFDLYIGQSGNSSARHIVDVGTAASSACSTPTVIMPEIYSQPGTGNGYQPVPIPLAVASGTHICARHRATTSTTIRAAIRGYIRGANDPPGFTTADQVIAADGAAQRASATTLSLVTTLTWSDLVTTSQAYGACVVNVGDSGTVSNPQGGRVYFGTGSGGGEVEVSSFPISMTTAAPLLTKGYGPLIQRSIPSGTHLSMSAVVATAGAGPDNIRPQIFCFR